MESGGVAAACSNHHSAMHRETDWLLHSANHQEPLKPVISSFSAAADENNNINDNNQQQWATAATTTEEFDFVDGREHKSDFISIGDVNNSTSEINNGVGSGGGVGEFTYYESYDQTGFPPSISSTASTLSSPTTSSDYNFNYHFDNFGGSSSDGLEQQYPLFNSSSSTSTNNHLSAAATYNNINYSESQNSVGLEASLYTNETATCYQPNSTPYAWNGASPYESGYYQPSYDSSNQLSNQHNCNEKMIFSN